MDKKKPKTPQWNNEARARMVAYLETLGIKSKQMCKIMGVKNTGSIANLRKRAKASGYYNKALNNLDEKFLDIRKELGEVASKAAQYMNLASTIALRNFYENLENEAEDQRTQVNISEAKLMADFLNSTEFSGKNNQKVDVNVLDHAQIAIEDAAEGIEDILSKYLPSSNSPSSTSSSTSSSSPSPSSSANLTEKSDKEGLEDI